MQEDFLYYVWRHKRFDCSDLRTTGGQPIEIIRPGERNTDAGPDFTDARLRIGDTLWAGNVEMHLRASEWKQHRHHEDRAYDNVILHVVLEEDEPVMRPNGERLPCLELKKRIPPKLSRTYKKLLFNEYWIPCQHHFFDVPEMTKRLWMDRLLVERLEERTAFIAQRLARNTQNWEETFYQLLARSFGVKVNADAFERLAQSLPLLTLARHKDNLFQIEAMLFGQAGMLEGTFRDEYPQRLQKEYAFLQKKYALQPIAGNPWRFLRMRPANFPTVRIAQFAKLIHQSAHLFSKALAAENYVEMEHMFELRISQYWQDHYLFDKPSARRNKTLGKPTIHLFIINTIAPFLFYYGRHRKEDRFMEQALRLLEEIPPENNSLIEKWRELGMTTSSACESQALLQLKNEYCHRKRCLECAIGNAILKTAPMSPEQDLMTG